MYDPITTPEQEARGFLAESRFFSYVNHVRYHLRGFARVEQGSALLDARGIDGFVFHYRRGTSAEPNRLPIQLKTKFTYEDARYHTTKNGIRVPILVINVAMKPQKMLDRVRQALDAFDASPREYEDQLRALEIMEPTRTELDLVQLIELSRSRNPAPPLNTSVDRAFETAQ